MTLLEFADQKWKKDLVRNFEEMSGNLDPVEELRAIECPAFMCALLKLYRMYGGSTNFRVYMEQNILIGNSEASETSSPPARRQLNDIVQYIRDTIDQYEAN